MTKFKFDRMGMPVLEIKPSGRRVIVKRPGQKARAMWMSDDPRLMIAGIVGNHEVLTQSIMGYTFMFSDHDGARNVALPGRTIYGPVIVDGPTNAYDPRMRKPLTEAQLRDVIRILDTHGA